eukprot:m51a1_g13348 hypothetical protein (352) ;mRNA; f:626-2164
MADLFERWHYWLCDCESVVSCLYGWFCPHCAMASARTYFDTSNWCFNCLVVPSALHRNVIREGYRLEGHYVGDIVISTCCLPCTASQVLSEVHSRGRVSGSGSGAPAISYWRHGFCDMLDGGFWRCLYACCCPELTAAGARTAYDGSSFEINYATSSPPAARPVLGLLALVAFGCFLILGFLFLTTAYSGAVLAVALAPLLVCLALVALQCTCGSCGIAVLRNIVREGYGIEGDCCSDLCLSVCCAPCAAAQLANEVSSRGPPPIIARRLLERMAAAAGSEAPKPQSPQHITINMNNAVTQAQAPQPQVMLQAQPQAMLQAQPQVTLQPYQQQQQQPPRAEAAGHRDAERA